MDPAAKGEHGLDAYTVQGDVNSPDSLHLAPRGTPLWHTGWYNIAPRAGLAWAIHRDPGKELILRAGAGVFFDTGDRAGLRAFSGLGFANSAHFLDVPLPVTPSELAIFAPGTPPYTGTNAFSFPSHLQLPYNWQWDVALEKALGRSQTLTISYVGSNGRRLLEEQRSNVSLANPNFGDITFFPAGLTSNYQAMQAKFQRSLVQGVQTLVSYTWAHALDYGSTDPAFPLIHGIPILMCVKPRSRSLLGFARPGGNYVKRNLLGGWRIDGRVLARTGFPVDLGGNFFLDPITGIPTRAVWIHSSTAAVLARRIPGISLADVSSTVAPTRPIQPLVFPRGAQGDAPRNLCSRLQRLPGERRCAANVSSP